jgi:cellulose synthase/poly-beta-1,6-N-acetylglucosamine synthase-like glycosyltransferase
LKQPTTRSSTRNPAAQQGQARIGKSQHQPKNNGTPIRDGAITTLAEKEFQKQVDHYTAWLAEKAMHLGSGPEELADYYERAAQPVHIRGQKVRPFAPLNPDLSAIKTVTPAQAAILMTLVALWAVAFFFSGISTLVISIAFVTTLYLGDLLLHFFIATRILTRSPEDHIDNAVVRAIRNDLWPRYTVLCPLYHEAVIVPQFVRAMSLLDYPVDKLQVLFLTEEDDAETREAILSMDLPAHFEVVTVPSGEPRTKPRACNFGLLKTTGDYVVIYDAEDIPDPLQLKKAVLAFANHPPEVACVQAKLNYYNPDQNLLTRWFTTEYSLWFDLTLPALQNARAPIPLGGTSNHFRTAVLRQVGGWDPFNVTEDCDLGLRLAHYRLQTAMLDSTTYEEANSRLKNWLRQRSRWIKGYMQTYFVHTRHPSRYLREGRLWNFLWLQFTVGARVAMLFINPLMWLLLALYIFFHSAVAPAYHILYPRPVLYLSAASLIFGNFFYLYTHLVGCLRRKQYSLMKWALLIPFYWGLMSVAASIALVQLIFKPHYWEKTQHGFHLLARARKRNHEKAAAARKARQNAQKNGLKEAGSVDLPISPIIDTLSTWRMPAIQAEFPTLELSELADMPTTKLSVVADLPTKKLAAIPKEARQEAHHAQAHRRRWRVRLPWTEDRWLGATIVTAVIMSIVACWYSYSHQFILLYGDAYAHLVVARAVFDSSVPGITQFGGVWLPLPHIIMQPFVWNDDLWRTGLAGSLSSMPCYIIAAIYVFRSARRLTHNSPASFVGTLAFVLNPNVLYLQATPLTEPVLMATMTAACYYFLAWIQENDPRQLIWAAAAMFLATLARYDGWALFLVCLVLIVLIGWLRRQRRAQIISNVLLFGTLGGLGIALWLLWCALIFNDPLYFQHGPYSSQLLQTGLIVKNRFQPYHDLWQSVRYFTLASIETLGPILFALAVLGLLIFIGRRWRSFEMFGALVFLVPFGFYVVSLYTGQATIFIPEAAPPGSPFQLYNLRYGSEMVAPAALFLATLVSLVPAAPSPLTWIRRLPLANILFGAAILVQMVLTFQGGIVSLQDGLYGISCEPTNQITLYLAQHYNGGKILDDIRTIEDFAEAGIDLKNVIYQASDPYWEEALKDPASVVDWVIEQPGDAVYTAINLNVPTFLERYTLVTQDRNISLFHRKGLPPLPTRPIPPGLLTEHALCQVGTAYGPNAFPVLARDAGYTHLADGWVRRD